MQAALGLRISQLLVMKWAPVYAAETGVLAGMLGGDVVEKTEAEVVGWLLRSDLLYVFGFRFRVNSSSR